ncbi:polysaccharide pyruvyl transferase family protein [Chloroflexota bacterium]
MAKILIINSTFEHFTGWEHNLGNITVMQCAIKALKGSLPNAQISTLIQLSDNNAEQWGTRVIRRKSLTLKSFSPWYSIWSFLNLVRASVWAILYRYLKVNIRFIIFGKKLREFYEADLILHLGLNDYSSDFGTRGVVEHSKDMLLAWLLRKPVVVYAESIGPFTTNFTSWLAKYTLNKVTLITVREEISYRYLRELDISKPPVHLTADLAFLLEPASKSRIEEIVTDEGIVKYNNPLIGLTISAGAAFEEESGKSIKLSIIASLYTTARYILPEPVIKALWALIKKTSAYNSFYFRHIMRLETAEDLISFLIEKYGARVVLIPHIEQKGTLIEDRELFQHVYQEAKYPDKITSITGYYSPEEFKGIIGRLDFYITVRMHTSIAAMSQYVPTILVLKPEEHRRGVIRMLGQEKYLCNRFSTDELIPKIEQVWINRNKIRKELESKMQKIREAALYNTELVRELMNIL